MTTNISKPNRGPLALGIVLASIALAACGSSNTNSSNSSSSSTNSTSAATTGSATSRTALATCLRQHGVTLPSGTPGAGNPPSGAPAGGSGSPPAGGPPSGFPGGGANNSKFRAALKACGANFPQGRAGGVSRQSIQKYVTCVRQHGYNLRNPNFSGNGPIFPSNVRSNAKFQTASKACQSLLAPPQPSGGATTSTS